MLSSSGIDGRMDFSQSRCQGCGGLEFVTDTETGEVVCSRCGLVARVQNMDPGPEWRAYTTAEKRVKDRVGAPTSLTQFDKGLSTTFQPRGYGYGRSSSKRDWLKMMRLRRWQIRSRTHTSAERNLSKAMNELTRLTDKLHVPRDVAENAALIYRRALGKGLVRGRSIKGIAAASLYAACRLTRTPRSLREVVEASTRSRKEVSRCYRLIMSEEGVKPPIDGPLKYVSKIASKAGLSQRTQNMAMDLLQRAKKARLDVGKAPSGMAAATLYIASIMVGENTTQRQIASASEVTEVTVRNRYKGLVKALSLEVRKKA